MAKIDLKILVSSAGRRVALINCFRQSARELGIGLEVLACDVSPELSSACHVADRAFAVPRCESPEFAEAIRTIATSNGVKLVIPTIDTELRALAGAVGGFASAGTRIHVSSPRLIDVVRDKFETARILSEAGLPTPQTFDFAEFRDRFEHLPLPLLMKPRGGSASRGLKHILTRADIPSQVEEPMVLQELVSGPEYTVNIYVDRRGQLRAAVPHRRLQVRAGEVEKGRTERHPEFLELAEGIVRALPGAGGVLCFQVIADPETGPKVIEINARFGGGYPLAHHAGATFTRWLLEEVSGLPSSANDDWRAGITMLRYDDAVFVG